jgi:hypothetical protein
LYSDVGVSAPAELKLNCEAKPALTSWLPVVVNILAWFDESVTTRMSTSFDRSLMALSR